MLGLVYFGRARDASAHVAFALRRHLQPAPSHHPAGRLPIRDHEPVRYGRHPPRDAVRRRPAGRRSAGLNSSVLFAAGRRFYGRIDRRQRMRALFAFTGALPGIEWYRWLLFLVNRPAALVLLPPVRILETAAGCCCGRSPPPTGSVPVASTYTAAWYTTVVFQHV